MEQTLRKLVGAYVDVSAANDASIVSAMLDPSCIRYIRPTSILTKLGAPADFSFDVATYEKTLASEMSVFKCKSVEISDVSIDTVTKKAAATSVYVNELVDGRAFRLEFGWHVNFTEDGAKITRIVEWCDGIEFLRFQAGQNELLDKVKAGYTIAEIALGVKKADE